MLLDVDGTLLDSNDAHAHAYVEALREVGVDTPFDKVRRLIGMGSDKLLPALGVEPHSKAGRDGSRRKKEIFKATYLPHLRPLPGARDLVLKLKKDDVKRIVASSASRDEVADLLRQAGVDDLIEDATSGSDVASSKPEPDIVREAVARAGMSEAELVMIGDTPYDVEAARRAGVRVVALRSGGWPDSALAGAEAIYDDPADVVRHYATSPIAR